MIEKRQKEKSISQEIAAMAKGINIFAWCSVTISNGLSLIENVLALSSNATR
jgi:hypothetical protein